MTKPELVRACATGHLCVPHRRRRALIVGISHYGHLDAKDQLQFADRDARAFADLLSSPLGGSVPLANIDLLVDTTARHTRILSALRQLSETAQDTDEIIIYFAGHGVQEEAETLKRTYLVTSDASPEGLVEENGITFEDFGRYVQRMRNKGAWVVVIADACHSGGMGVEAQLAETRWSVNSQDGGGGPLTELLASSHDEPSREDIKWGNGHGVFTYYLLEGWRGKAADTTTGVLSIHDLFEYVRKNVMLATQADKPQQTPDLVGADDDTLWTAPPESLRVFVYDSTKAPRVLAVASTSGEARGEVDRMREAHVGARPPGGHADRAVQAQVVAFDAAITARRLIAPQPNNAWDIYGRLRHAPQAAGVLAELARTLEASLEIDADRVLRRYVQGGNDSRTMLGMRADLPSDSAFANAGVELRSALALVPEDDPMRRSLTAQALFLEGYVFVKRLDAKRYPAAKRMLEQSIALEPRAAYGYNALGLLYWRLEAYDSASYYFQRAIDRAGSWAFPRANLAGVDAELGRHRRALDEYHAALGADSLSTYAHNELGNEYLSLGHYAAAEREYRKALAIKPTYTVGWSNLAFVYRIKRRFGDAESYLARAYESQRHDTLGASGYWLAIERGRLHRDEGKRTAALADFRRAATLLPLSPEPLDDLGDTYQQFGVDSSLPAEHAYRRALAVDSLDEWAHNGLAATEQYSNPPRMALAEHQLQWLVQRRPRSPGPRLYLGDFYARLALDPALRGNRDTNLLRATTSYDEARALDTLSGVPYMRLGALATVKGDWPAAEQFYRRRVDLDSASPEAADSLGVFYRHRELMDPVHGSQWRDSAIAAFRRSILVDSEYPNAYDELARIDLDRGLIDSAVADCRRAARLPFNSMSPGAYAATFVARATEALDSGNVTLATAAYRAARAVSPSDVTVLGQMAHMFYAAGQPDEALAYSDSSIATLRAEDNGTLRRTRMLRARILIDANNASDALAILESLPRSHDSRTAEWYLTHALAVEATGDDRRAIVSYSHAERLAGARAVAEVITSEFSPQAQKILLDVTDSAREPRAAPTGKRVVPHD